MIKTMTEVDRTGLALNVVQEYIQNHLYNPYDYEISVDVDEDDECTRFVISTEKWSMDFEPENKSLVFNGDRIDYKEFDQIKEIRDNGDKILCMYNNVLEKNKK